MWHSTVQIGLIPELCLKRAEISLDSDNYVPFNRTKLSDVKERFNKQMFDPFNWANILISELYFTSRTLNSTVVVELHSLTYKVL